MVVLAALWMLFAGVGIVDLTLYACLPTSIEAVRWGMTSFFTVFFALLALYGEPV